MPTITVVKPFMLQLDPRPIPGAPPTIDAQGNPVAPIVLPDKIVFVPGVHEVSPEVAEHWYTKLHLDDYEEAPPTPGMAEYAAAEIAAEAAPGLMPHPGDVGTQPRAAAPPASAQRSVPKGPAPVKQS